MVEIKEKEEVVEVESKEEHDAISEVMHCDPDIFLAKAITALQGLPLATKRRKAKSIAADAKLYETQAQMNGNRYDSKKWNAIAWSLSTQIKA